MADAILSSPPAAVPERPSVSGTLSPASRRTEIAYALAVLIACLLFLLTAV